MLAPLLELQRDLCAQAYAAQDIGTSLYTLLADGLLTPCAPAQMQTRANARARPILAVAAPRLSDQAAGEERDVVPSAVSAPYN